MKEIELVISQFIDNELNDEEQKKLFVVLAEDQNLRQTLSDFMQIKKNTSEHYKNITTELFRPAIKQTGTEPNKKYKTMFYFSLAASIVFATLLAWNQNSKDEISKQYYALQSQFKSLERQYSNVKEMKTEKESFSQLLAKKNVRTKFKKWISLKTIPRLPNAEFLSRIKQKYEAKPVNSVAITKEDFIGGQIVGN